jgi:hypothetical protein
VWNSRLYQPDKSAVAEHSIEEGHRFNCKETGILARTMGCMD